MCLEVSELWSPKSPKTGRVWFGVTYILNPWCLTVNLLYSLPLDPSSKLFCSSGPMCQVSQQLTALLRIWTLSSQSTLGLYYNVTDLEERWDSTWPGHGGAGGEQGDCLLRAQRLVPGQVMLLKQRSEELQTSGGQFYAGAWRGGNGADHLIPDQAQVATVVKPCHSFKTISLTHFLRIVHVVLR